LAHNFSFNDTDKRIAQEIQGKLPDRLFDIHGHIYKYEHMHSPTDEWMSPGPTVADVAAYREHIGRQVGIDRLRNGLFFAMPSLKMEMEKANEFLIEQVARTPGSRGLLLVGPNTPRELAEKWLNNDRIVGFKPYSFFSTEDDKYACAPETFIPDWAWELAQERGLIITLHVVKEGAISDAANYQYVRGKCTAYPNAKLILAHCGRSFYAPNARKGLAMIRGLKNVWFDTAAVCEPGPFITVIREFGVEKLMWGTDFPDSEIRGRCVTIGEGFFWIQPDTVSAEPGYSGFHPTLVGLESTRALLEAADYLELTNSDIESVFHNNAMQLLGE
jgi:glutamate-1-semialdehyde 2,1-aminomutase